ncbi:MAG: hypothetical protein JJU02_08390 [Cryomorphaceae bacterium]|nr:hypothetical protein [Cryomorphaceae bacterium]
MVSIKIEGIFEPEQVRIQKSTDKEDFGRKGLFRADSQFRYLYYIWPSITATPTAQYILIWVYIDSFFTVI